MDQKNTEQKRILNIVAGPLVNRGVEKVLMSYYKNIDRNKIQFDFITPEMCKNDEMRNAISSLGGQLFELNIIEDDKVRWLFLYKKALRAFLNSHHYEIVMITTGSIPVLAMATYVAKIAGVKTRIVYSQNTGILSKRYKIIKMLSTPVLQFLPTHYWACSGAAGHYTFPKAIQDKIIIMPNAIDSSLFAYDSDTRICVRKKLNIEDKFVVGHIGAFIPQKNHSFLIDVFFELRSKCSNAILLLIGSGEKEDEIRNKVEALNLSDSVIFYGNTYKAHELYQAMDCFVFTSHYEGLGIVAIEAQAAGLKTLCSEAIPQEANITKQLEYMSLTDPPEKWADRVLTYKNYQRENLQQIIIDAGYDIKSSAKEFEKICNASTGGLTNG